MGFGLRTGVCKVPSRRARRPDGATAWMPGLRCTAVCLSAVVPLTAAAATRFSGTAFGLRPALALPDAPLQAIPDALMGSNSSFFISDALLQASGAFVQITWQAANLQLSDYQHYSKMRLAR